MPQEKWHQRVITATLTPSQAEEPLADESGPHLARDSHVGLPRLCQDPAERGQEKEVQKGCCHRADTLLRHMESRHLKKKKKKRALLERH